MRTLLERPPAPTGVFASNDRLAIGAMRAVVEAGLRVPEDVSVVGVDDIELAPYLTPPLTTVRQSLTDVATLATKILLDLLQGDEPATAQVVFQPELVVRHSTALPPDKPHAEGGVPQHDVKCRESREQCRSMTHGDTRG